jgi:catechol 2,3-dioxygenase-like lactoylglutathione lyase family enzyme
MKKRADLKFHHNGVSVPDLAASIAWYRDMLGFEVDQRMRIDAIPADVAMLKRGPLRIELFEVKGAAALPEQRRDPQTDPHTHGNKHVAFAVEDVDTIVAELTERGADIVFVGRMPFGTFVFIRDNAGNLVEFVQQPDLWASGAHT